MKFYPTDFVTLEGQCTWHKSRTLLRRAKNLLVKRARHEARYRKYNSWLVEMVAKLRTDIALKNIEIKHLKEENKRLKARKQ
jgi:hypothetical protein